MISSFPIFTRDSLRTFYDHFTQNFMLSYALVGSKVSASKWFALALLIITKTPPYFTFISLQSTMEALTYRQISLPQITDNWLSWIVSPHYCTNRSHSFSARCQALSTTIIVDPSLSRRSSIANQQPVCIASWLVWIASWLRINSQLPRLAFLHLVN